MTLSRKLTGLATLSKSKPRADLERNVVDKVTDKLNIVAGHDKLVLNIRSSGRESQPYGHVSGTNEQLWTVVLLERSVATTYDDRTRGANY